MSNPPGPPPPPPAPKSTKGVENAAKTQAYADGLFSVRWNAGLGTPEALVFSADARGRGEHLVGPAQRARQREANRGDSAEGRVVIPLLTVLRKLTNRGHMDVEVDAALAFGQLERLRYLRRELSLLTAHTPAELDADPMLAYRMDRLLQMVNGFGYSLPAAGHVLEVEALSDVIDCLESIFPELVAQTRDAIAQDGAVGYQGLQEVYHIGDLVTAELGSLGGTRVAYRVGDVRFDTNRSVFGTVKLVFHIALEYIAPAGDDAMAVSFEEVYDDWPGVRAVSTLLYQPNIPPPALANLTARGTLAATFATGHHYRQYRAGCFFPNRARGSGTSGSTPSASVLAGPGKIVVDVGRALSLGYNPAPGYDSPSLAFQQNIKQVGVLKRASPDGESDERRRERMRTAGLQLLPRVPDELVAAYWPAVNGFSLSAKHWGLVLVEGLSDVESGAGAWESLVLPAAKKELLLALAATKLCPPTAARRASVDAIPGKGAGSLFLLHGPPGVGKTMTAEALAGHFGRPLYCLTFGELGSTVPELEARMNEVLQLCAAWRCVCLLDEGDALVERREKGALVLNSLVSVLLKSLDAFEGLLFLTTNRVTTFDPAALSRVTLAIRYPALDDKARATIWRDVLLRAGADPARFDLESLARSKYSGRTINNTVRLALSLAAHRGLDLNQAVLDETLAIVDDFQADIATADAF